MRKKIIYAFTGPSNSGKTTLIEKLAKYFIKKGFKVAIIKHDPKDKATFDKEGKDSYKFFQTGADVAVISPKKSAIFKHQEEDINNIIECLEFDILLIEGLKTLNFPRIGVFRNKIEKDYLNYINALAVDSSIKGQKDIDKDILDLNNISKIANYILNKGD